MAFDEAVFRNPPAEYRGAPLFAWNSNLPLARLERHLRAFREMGLGGFHIHPRTGLAVEYLGAEFMSAVRYCLELGNTLGLRTYLYDEDRWPSGAAGGLATTDPAHHMRYLRWTRRLYGHDTEDPHSYWPPRYETGELVASFDISLDDCGFLRHYELVNPDHPTGRVWHVYSETWEPSDWFAGNAYIDTLSEEAIKKFLQITHERYQDAVGSEFGETIPSIFTDEPQFAYFYRLDHHDQPRDCSIPFTSNYFHAFQDRYGYSLLEHMPEIVWDLPGGRPNLTRYHYINLITDTFVRAFSEQVGEWCTRHNIALTGHLMEESTLFKQTRAVGDAMRCYRAFHLPGIDILCGEMELLTAKQAQSAARQFGREGVTSELYGVTNWNYTFAQHKQQGDWQAALGVTFRVHHLTWLSMGGESKRDYPASIGLQSPWYRHYRIVEDHFARLGTVLTRGRPVCRVAVLHPIETFWLNYGPYSTSGATCDTMDQRLDQLIRWLLFHHLDFDFINESLLDVLPTSADVHLQIGEGQYDVVILPDCRTLRKSTVDLLRSFCGEVIIVGAEPDCIDGIPSIVELPCTITCTWDFDALQTLLESYKEVRIVDLSGKAVPGILVQVREESDVRFLFLCNTELVTVPGECVIHTKGEWQVEEMNTVEGSIQPVPANRVRGWTSIRALLHGHSSKLFRLSRSAPECAIRESTPCCESEAEISLVGYRLSEPNVLLLDQARWRVDGGAWHDLEETLRIENCVRQKLGLRANDGQLRQPWADTKPLLRLVGVELEFSFHSEIALEDCKLAIELESVESITVDEIEIPLTPTGHFVDDAIATLVLPRLSSGMHNVRVRMGFHRRTNLEWCYLLGNFGVKTVGRRAEITALPTAVEIGNLVCQGFPFYGGDFVYQFDFECVPSRMSIEVRDFCAPLVTICLDGNEEIPIAFDPFQADLGHVDQGKHRLEVTAVGSRINTFGQVHCCDPNRKWFGPDSWRTTGENYTYEYQLQPMGLMSIPKVFLSDRPDGI